MSALPQNFEDLHPSLWRGSQLARAAGMVVDTGYETLSAELPGGGWPVGTVIECLTQQTGIGELRLLAPALASHGKRPVVFLEPPQTPNSQGLAYMGLSEDRLMWLRARRTADALWTAEQVLRTGSCAALLFWQQRIRTESLRRLQLAAKSSETLFFVFRPLVEATNPSPAELRVALRPAENGLNVEILKRKGPMATAPLQITLRPAPTLLSPHGRNKRTVIIPNAPVQREAAVVVSNG
ncbi:translesion DNA synthesis-associated protein ImuA [Paraburkholderia ultramafica]|nr:translesion DNA synthesis-associated protein ImuA [Paraburkholderia ultramafica]